MYESWSQFLKGKIHIFIALLKMIDNNKFLLAILFSYNTLRSLNFDIIKVVKSRQLVEKCWKFCIIFKKPTNHIFHLLEVSRCHHHLIKESSHFHKLLQSFLKLNSLFTQVILLEKRKEAHKMWFCCSQQTLSFRFYVSCRNDLIRHWK